MKAIFLALIKPFNQRIAPPKGAEEDDMGDYYEIGELKVAKTEDGQYCIADRETNEPVK